MAPSCHLVLGHGGRSALWGAAGSDLQQQLKAASLGSRAFSIISFVSQRQQLPQTAQALLGKKRIGLEGKQLMENEEGGWEGEREGGREQGLACLSLPSWAVTSELTAGGEPLLLQPFSLGSLREPKEAVPAPCPLCYFPQGPSS